MYTVGEKVAHPMHGAGVIEQILPREEWWKERLFLPFAPLCRLHDAAFALR